MSEPIHDVVHRNWWNGVSTTRCGQRLHPGEKERLILARITCSACKKAKKQR